MMKQFYLLFILLFSIEAFAQNPLIVKTVGGSATEPGTNIINKLQTAWKGKIFYESKTGGNLVVTDGTNAGTQVIKTFDANYIADGIYPAQDFVFVTVLKSDAVFNPNNTITVTYTRQLWKSDGTAAGTILLYTFNSAQSAFAAGTFTSNLGNTENYSISGNTMYFNGYSTAEGNELWVSDGTAAGTRLVKDIRPGSLSSSVHSFTKAGNTVLFFANDGSGVGAIWKTDGTEAGTGMLKPINLAYFGSGLYKGKMYFWGNDGINGTELWTSDGTAAGTIMLKDITPGSGSSFGSGVATRGDMTFIKDNNYLYFVLNNNGPLWRTDGTEAGTIQLSTDATGGATNGAYAKGNSLYWLVGTTTLYKTNGTPSSTTLVKNNLVQGIQLYNYKDAAWFNARAANNSDVEPWRSDGTAANTNRALDVFPGVVFGIGNSSSPYGYFELNGYMFFFATNAAGVSLFRYNGDFTFNNTVAGSNWRDSANWNSVMPPGITDTAYINSGTVNVNGSKAYAGTLIMQSGSNINVVGATDSLFINKRIQGTTTTTGNGTLILKSFNGESVQLDNTLSAAKLNADGALSVNGNVSVSNNLNLTNNARLSLNNNNITLTGTSSTITTAANSYIVTNGTGKLAIENIGSGGRTGSVLFPVGSEINYNPVTISNAGTMDAFSARTEPGIKSSYTGEASTGTPYTMNAVNNTWFITEGIAGGSNANITLQWNASQELPGFNRAQSQFGHYANGNWMLSGGTAAAGSDPFTITGTGITSFSPFGVLNGSASLPLYSISINASRIGNNNSISWNIVATEMQELIIEKSIDGRNFSTLRSQSFTTSGNILHDATNSKIYYRIRLSDLYGKVSYSRIVWIDGKKGEVHIYPTLFTNKFTIHQTIADKADLIIIDGTGKLALKQSIQSRFAEVNASSLSKGNYIYQLRQPDGTVLSKGVIIKQ